MAPPDFKSGREAETSPVGSIPSRFRHASSHLEAHHIMLLRKRVRRTLRIRRTPLENVEGIVLPRVRNPGRQFPSIAIPGSDDDTPLGRGPSQRVEQHACGEVPRAQLFFLARVVRPIVHPDVKIAALKSRRQRPRPRDRPPGEPDDRRWRPAGDGREGSGGERAVQVRPLLGATTEYVSLRVIAPAVLSYRLTVYVAFVSGIDAIWVSSRGMSGP